jgi:hypothetical protein
MTHKLEIFKSGSFIDLEERVNTFTEKLPYETDSISFFVNNDPTIQNSLVYTAGVVYNDKNLKKEGK